MKRRRFSADFKRKVVMEAMRGGKWSEPFRQFEGEAKGAS